MKNDVINYIKIVLHIFNRETIVINATIVVFYIFLLKNNRIFAEKVMKFFLENSCIYG